MDISSYPWISIKDIERYIVLLLFEAIFKRLIFLIVAFDGE